MLGWAIGFFVAAVVAAMFGFGAIASTFASVAVILFWVFVGLFVISLILSLVNRGTGHGPVASSGGGVAFVAIIAAVAILGYAWVQNDWSAQGVGREIDQTAAEITADASDVLEEAGDRAETLVDNANDDLTDNTNEDNR